MPHRRAGAPNSLIDGDKASAFKGKALPAPLLRRSLSLARQSVHLMSHFPEFFCLSGDRSAGLRLQGVVLAPVQKVGLATAPEPALSGRYHPVLAGLNTIPFQPRGKGGGLEAQQLCCTARAGDFSACA